MSDGGPAPGAPRDRDWGALELEVPPHVEALLLGVLVPHCTGAWTEAASPGRERLTAYFADVDAATHALEAVEAHVRRAGLDPAVCGLRVRRVADGRWVERYQASLRPFDVGRRFTIDPSGRGTAGGDRISVPLVPGRAFGTGEHATTRLCLEALERRVEAGSRWVDLGCGSGILSVVAARCGAARVLGLDVDPLAIEVAREVVTRNGLEETIRLECGTIDAASPGEWDGVVVNVSGSFLTGAGGGLAGMLRCGGALVASGFLGREAGELMEAFAVHGLRETERSALGEWGLLICTAESEPGR